MRILRPIRLVMPFALLLAACNDAPAADTTVPPSLASTTTTTIVLEVRSTAASPVTVAPGVGSDAADALLAEIEILRSDAESLRGLGFIGAPQIAVLDQPSFVARRTELLEGPLDAPALAVESRLYRLLGLLEPGQDLRGLVLRSISSDVAAFYDSAVGELVVNGATGELGPGQRSVLIRELVLMLTDQYHDHSDRVEQLGATGFHDEALALAALATADALYAQLRYLDGLPAADQQAALAEQTVGVAPGPEFLADQLAFPSEGALGFVGWALEEGGFPELDAAYEMPTTEALLHPTRYQSGEGVLAIEPPSVSVPGYRIVDEGTFGELRLEGMLSASLSPGFQTQVGDGWGADRFVLLASADDVAFAYIFKGDSANDTFEVAQAFLDHAQFVMGMNDAVAVGGGAEFVGVREGASEGPYVFVDRQGDGLVAVIASTVSAGRALRDQLEPP